MKKVLHVVGSMNFGGGIEAWLMDVLSTFDRRNYQIDLCYTDQNPGNLASQVRELKVKMIPCTMGLNYWPFVNKLKTCLYQSHYDAIHVHLQNFSGPAIHASRCAGVPVRIAHFHSTREGHNNDLLRRLYLWPLRRWVRNDATRIVGCSRAALAAFFPDLVRQYDFRLKPLYYGIDLELYRRNEGRSLTKEELGISNSTQVIGHIGRFSYEKNHLGLVKIAEKILSKLSDVRFLLIGDGKLRNSIQQHVARLGIDQAFIFLGHRHDIPQLLKIMDVFLFPSLWEGFGKVLIEAQAASVPVVASNIPGINEAIVEPCRKFLFPLEDYEKASENVIGILNNPVIIKTEIERNKDLLNDFDIKHNLSNLYSLYEL